MTIEWRWADGRTRPLSKSCERMRVDVIVTSATLAAATVAAPRLSPRPQLLHQE
jgi:hypothetical protein